MFSNYQMQINAHMFFRMKRKNISRTYPEQACPYGPAIPAVEPLVSPMVPRPSSNAPGQLSFGLSQKKKKKGYLLATEEFHFLSIFA